MAACRAYREATGRRIFIEYLLLEGVNDTDAHAAELAALLAGGGYHVNLISYNPTQAGYTGSGQARVAAFAAVLASWACRPPTAAPMDATSTPPVASSPSATCGGCAVATAPPPAASRG